MRDIFAAGLSLLILSAGGAETFERITAGRIWQDGLFVGNGSTAALGFAPAGMEWVINHHEVLDARVYKCRYLSHREVMATVATNAGHSVSFLRPAELPQTEGFPDSTGKLTCSLSAACLKMRFWPGTGWSMPSIPRTSAAVDTRTGELTMRMNGVLSAPETISFVEREHDVLVIMTGEKKGTKIPAWVELSPPDDVRLNTRPFAWRNDAQILCFTQAFPGGGFYAVAMTGGIPGAVMGRTGQMCLTTGDALQVAVRVAKDANTAEDAAKKALRAMSAKDLQVANRAWWKHFWDIGAEAHFTSAPTIDTAWHYACYALASQFGAAPMPALNGLAYGPLGGMEGGVGSNCYVHDQNVQIPMMPFFPLGHAAFVETFIRTYEQALPELRRRTKEVFGSDVEGVYLPLNMNQYGYEHPICDYRYTLCGSAYSGLVLVHAWRYSHDEKLLKRLYPLLREFVMFYVSTMTRDTAGTYHTLWSVPPEIFTGTKDDTTTVSCLKPCLEILVAASRKLGLDAERRRKWEDILAHYPSIAKHPDGGWWCGPDIPHDHYMFGGHLFYPFFPAEVDTDAETAKKTLAYTWHYGYEISHETMPPHPVHEWSAFYTGMATMRLFGGARGWQAMEDFQTWFSKPNGLYSHNPIIVTSLTADEIHANVARQGTVMRRYADGKMHPVGRGGRNDLVRDVAAKALVAPVLEGGAAFLMLANEALCQSREGRDKGVEVLIFPGVKGDFTGHFKRMRVRGGYRVSAAMENGKVRDCRIEGVPQGTKIRVTCPVDPGFVYRAL